MVLEEGVCIGGRRGNEIKMRKGKENMNCEYKLGREGS